MPGTRRAVPGRALDRERPPLRARLGRILTRPWLLWTLAATFTIRLAVLNLHAGGRPDGEAQLLAGRRLFTDPALVYGPTAEFIARHHLVPPLGLLDPPAAALLAAPFGLLTRFGLALWTLGDALAAVAGLWLVYRALRPEGWRRPLYWAIAAYFPPLFAEIDASQLGGYLLLLGCASMVLTARRPGMSGAIAGLAAAIKVYPAAMVLAAGPARLRRFLPAMIAAGAAVTAVAAVPLGLDGVQQYVRGVLLPAARGSAADCGIDSVSTMFQRTVGGSRYAVLGAGGTLQWIQLGLHQPGLATVLTYITIATLVGAGLWAAWRSGWHPLYGPALAFGLGSLVPAEVNAYQYLPLLPVVLLVAVRARTAGAAGLLAIGLLGFARQPCSLPWPDVWTLAGLVLFGVAVASHSLFAPSGGAGRGDMLLAESGTVRAVEAPHGT